MVQVLQRESWYGEPRKQGEVFVLHKGPRPAASELWDTRLGALAAAGRLGRFAADALQCVDEFCALQTRLASAARARVVTHVTLFEMKKNVVIAALLLLVMFLCARIIHIENQRYALEVGLCRPDPSGLPTDFACLRTVQTRTSWIWHLYYALTGD